MAVVMASRALNVPSQLLAVSSRQLENQFVRHKGYRRPLLLKPRWIPRAKTKMFVLPRRRMIPDNEINQILKLKFEHQDKIAAITQYLWEDYLKNSDVGEVARIEAKREQEEHERLLEENEKLNVKVAEGRAKRLETEKAQTRQKIVEEVEQFEAQRAKETEVTERLIELETDDLANVLATDEQLERAILEAMDNPIDYEYSIDLAGHIYTGRHTKARIVPEDERQKIPRPPRESEKILGIDKAELLQ